VSKIVLPTPWAREKFKLPQSTIQLSVKLLGKSIFAFYRFEARLSAGNLFSVNPLGTPISRLAF
jgi:hypothetical protein